MSVEVARSGSAWQAVARRLARPSILIFGANMLRAGCGFLVTLLAARLLGPSEFGHFATFLTLTIFAYALVGEGFDPGVVRLYSKAREAGPAAQATVLGSALVLRLVLAVPMLVMFLGAAAWWLDPQMAAIARFAAPAALGASCAMLALAVVQAGERFRVYVCLAPLANLLRVAAMPLLWLAGAVTLPALMWVHALAFAIVAVAGVWVSREQWLKARHDGATMRGLLRFGIWSSLANACFLVVTYLPVPLLNHVKGPAQGGLYSVAATLLMFIDQYTAALLTARLAATSRLESAADLRRFAAGIAPRLLMLAAGLCLLFPAATLIVSSVFGDAYAGAGEVMRALLPGFIATLVSHPLYLVLYAMDRPHAYAASGVAALIAFGLLSAWLLPEYGMIGIAWATSGARALQALIIIGLVLHGVRHRRAVTAAGPHPRTP